MFKNLKNGFTLTELVTTIAIIVILSAISGPIYNSYTVKAQQTEGYLLLGTIKTFQEKYYNDYGYFFYNGWNYSSNMLGIDARANKYYTRFNVGTAGNDQNFIKFRGEYGNQFKSFIAYAEGKGRAVTMFCDIERGTTIK